MDIDRPVCNDPSRLPPPTPDHKGKPVSTVALPPDLARLAANQHGVLSRPQLADGGLTEAHIRYRTNVGALRPDLGETFVVMGAPATARQRYAAATLAVSGGVLGVEAAANLHEFDSFGPTTPIVLTDLSRHHDLPGIVIRRRSDLLPRHCCVVDGIAATTIPRTVLDLAAYVSCSQLISIVDSLTDTRRMSIRVLFDEFDRVARRGRNGTRIMRRVLEPRLAALTVDRSELERRGIAFLRLHGFPPPEVEFRPPWAGPALARVDLAWPDLRVVLELDSRMWHDRSDRFENDRLRDQLAMSAGWIVVRVTWRQLHDDPDGVAARLRAILDNRNVGGSR